MFIKRIGINHKIIIKMGVSVMNLKKAAKGIDSDDLETRVRSAIFLLNLDEEKVYYPYGTRELLLKRLTNDTSTFPHLVYSLKDLNDKRLMWNALFDIAMKGKQECGLAVVQMQIFSENLSDEAMHLACIIQGTGKNTPHELVKNEAIKALSTSLNIYLKFKNPIWTASYSPITYVAGFGDDPSSAKAFEEITSCDNFYTKLYSLCSIVEHRKKLCSEAAKLVCDLFDQIVELPQHDINESRALQIIIEYASQNLALKALEQYNRRFADNLEPPLSLEFIAKSNKNSVIAAKAREYFAQYEKHPLGDKILNQMIKLDRK